MESAQHKAQLTEYKHVFAELTVRNSIIMQGHTQAATTTSSDKHKATQAS